MAFDFFSQGKHELTKTEFRAAFKAMGEEFTEEDIDGIFNDLDDDGGGTIDRLAYVSLEFVFVSLCLCVRGFFCCAHITVCFHTASQIGVSEIF